MGLEFRRRDYRAEELVHSLQRARADTHPLSASSSPLQVEECESEKDDFCDPLRVSDGLVAVSSSDVHREDVSTEATAPSQLKTTKGWISYKKMLMQRFPVSKTSPMSVQASGVHAKGSKAIEKSARDLHSGGLDDDKNFDDEDVKVISQQEHLSKLHGLKDEINQYWCAGDRVTSLRLSIKAVRSLMDSSAIQIYPTLFVLATDIMDMLGDLVWNRIKEKAEITEENFNAGDICFDAKETCNNWFSKVGSIRELLPRIYLELALLPCWRFLHDHPENILKRLVEMTRGIADPLASAYCRLYLAQCSQRLSQHDTGFLIACINDLKLVLVRLTPARETVNGNLSGNSQLLLTLVEPAIEYIIKCLFKDLKKMEISKMLLALGLSSNLSILSKNHSCISVVLHHILKELPVEYICSNAVELLQLIEITDDRSFDQSLNFNLLGHRLCELVSQVSNVQLLIDKFIQVLSCCANLHAYLMLADAYLDIILENHLDKLLNVILDGILERVRDERIGENELVILQSVFLKILTHFGDIKKILALNHFIDILDMMHGSTRNSINMHILNMATRNGQIQDPIIIEVLLEVAQALYNGLDFSNMRKDEYQHPSRLISRFVYMVDHGIEVESHLRFLAQCRGAFSSINELQENLVHSSNNLAIRAMRNGNSSISFVKSCLAFNEVTIPAIPANLRQLNLYIETAEVALLGGFVSHLDGLLNAAVNCLEMIDPVNVMQMAEDGDEAISLICKLCGLLVMVPGGVEPEVTYIPQRLLSLLNSQAWILPRMKAKIFSAFVFLSAAQSQNQLLYHAVSGKVICNYQLFVGFPSDHQELLSLSRIALQGILNCVMQESSKERGKLALESCNCVASSFMVSDETLEACSKLVEIAKSCYSADDKFLQSTLKFLNASQFHL
ncbi:VPS35 endosomal protein sorting factor-like isoform X2 [Salvia hispanica]|uniref:VPS35 endosomal protein sorting factor-like isoform X2 n=1 Tax=Salvia hispanica TaxID=49212 RepID=UPI0020091BD5|nr:VPS35 endosomal protein sorting factor-like isoform X2 [Salvia hispanica]